MTLAQEELCLRTLHDLVGLGIEFCVTGTFALRWQYPALIDWPVADCDILLPNDAALLNKLVGYLQQTGWQVSLWDEPVHLPLTAAQLAAKYYLRARQAGAIFDCSYENEVFSWVEFAARVQWRHNLPLASAEQILLLKAQRNSLADQQVIQLCGEAVKE